MTATNIDPISQAVSTFSRLDIDDRLATLGLLYTEIADEIPANVIDSLPTGTAAGLVAQIQRISPEQQLSALRDILPATRNDQDEVILDPHPSKAAVELVQGGTTVPTGQYGALSIEEKLAFWYMLAERLGTNIIDIPSDYEPSEQAQSLCNSLLSLNTNDIVAFLQRVL
ncbi:MAG TPA: orange carotenoid protein N-terminal domain-containing protein [Nostocaceae cyanobacterium]|nr:orange carotenoid protein N-terminal domain-containing protein [Nostocaceae cyanobacterium]